MWIHSLHICQWEEACQNFQKRTVYSVIYNKVNCSRASLSVVPSPQDIRSSTGVSGSISTQQSWVRQHANHSTVGVSGGALKFRCASFLSVPAENAPWGAG